jgi:hypothetical protein
MEGRPRKESLFGIGDPDTYGEAVAKGEADDFIINTPEKEKATMTGARDIIGDKTPVDEFNTRYGIKAKRWLASNNMDATPETIAAVAAVDKVGLKTNRESVAASSWILQSAGPQALNQYTIKAAIELKRNGKTMNKQNLFAAAKIIKNTDEAGR